MKFRNSVSILAVFFTAFFATNVAYSQTGCYPDWSYKAPVSVTNPNSLTLTNHQVLITLNTQALISSGKMNMDGSDIRFSNSCCNSLCYYIESGINTSTTEIWVNVDSITANGNNTIYLYYGNAAATNSSDASCTFDLFEDFNGAMPEFYTECGTVTENYTGSNLSLGWSSSGIIVSNTSFSQNKTFTAEASVSSASGSWAGLYWIKPDNKSYGLLINTTDVRISLSGGGTEVCSGHNWASGLIPFSSPTGIWSHTWVATGDIASNFPTAGAVTSTNALYAKDADLRLGIGGISSGSGSIDLDWIRVRKYADIVPTYSVNPEELNNGTGPLIVDLANDSSSICLNSNLSVDAGVGFNSYSWSTGGGSQTELISTSGMVYIECIDNIGCISNDSILILDYPVILVNIGIDTVICDGESISIDAGAGFNNYTWSNGGNTQLTSLTSDGDISIEAIDTNGCSSFDTITISYFPSVIASFSSSINDYSVTFNDASTNVNAYSWDFGDGTFSSIENPIHTYSTTGSFNVCLTVTSSDGCTNESCSPIIVSMLGIEEVSFSEFNIYPNPSVNSFFVQSTSQNESYFQMIDLSGSLVQEGVIKFGENKIETNLIQNGVYMFLIKNESTNYSFKVILK